MAYRELRKNELAIDYFKYQLSLAWELQDLAAEMRSYDNLAIEYYYVGDLKKAQLYHERVITGRREPPNSTAKLASTLVNNYQRKFVEVKYNFDQGGIKGTSAQDKGKRANFGDSTIVKRFVPQEEQFKHYNEIDDKI